MAKTISLSGKKRTLPARRTTKRNISTSRARAGGPRRTNGRKRVNASLLREMTRRLVTEFDPEQVILFGSYAWGKPTKDSDVDLMVIVSASDESDVKRMLRGSNALEKFRVPKDVVVKTRAEFDRYKDVYASLESLIQEKGKVLYDERTETRARPKLAHQSAS